MHSIDTHAYALVGMIPKGTKEINCETYSERLEREPTLVHEKRD